MTTTAITGTSEDPADGVMDLELEEPPAGGRRLPSYRLWPDDMEKAAAALGCQLWNPHTGRDFTWTPDPAVIVVTINSTETKWWQPLGEAATAVCFPPGRLKWKSHIQGTTVLYFGDDVARFKAEFKRFGAVAVEFAKGETT